jgi:hypothetical protein
VGCLLFKELMDALVSRVFAPSVIPPGEQTTVIGKILDIGECSRHFSSSGNFIAETTIFLEWRIRQRS